MNDAYEPAAIENKWTVRWRERRAHDVDVRGAQRPYYNLMMFPYPSAEGLHVGNVFAFVGADIHGRFMRARGYDVFEPMGLDAFGMHSENYAMKVGVHPGRLIRQNAQNFKRQLARIGAMFDWPHELCTTDPSYYRWTQWIFVQLLKAGLAYRAEAPVNWCPSCATVLADEQAPDGRCERCDTTVEKRPLVQWFFRITAYAQRLLDGLDHLDWSARTVQAQRHWIGRTEVEGKVRFRLRDWCVSRQRYWGTPIPVVYCSKCGIVPEERLPVLLPHVEDFRPDGTGRSPLARSEGFVHTSCPRCGAIARRETDVCDNFLDSAWFYMRYPSVGGDDRPFDPELMRKWLPVNMYIGGNEHAVLHLMYSRFLTMALHDMGHIEFSEPFRQFRAHGIIVKDGAKMSKSKGNVINPDHYIDLWGADTFRCYLMFMGDYQHGGDFRDAGIAGMARFLQRVWRHVTDGKLAEGAAEDERALHRAIAKVTLEIENLHYNTAISAVMELLNWITESGRRDRRSARILLQLLAPFAPFMTQELWERMGEAGLIVDAPWPVHDQSKMRQNETVYVVQVDGKVRDRIVLGVDASEKDVTQAAMRSVRVQPWVAGEGAGAGRIVCRVVFVPGKLVNVVTKERRM